VVLLFIHLLYTITSQLKLRQMKKLLLSASLFANVVFLLLACQKEKVSENTPTLLAETRQAPSEDGTVIAAGSSGCPGAAPTMPYGLVRDMILNYQTKQQRAIENTLGIRDASACWFDLIAMKNYICHLEEKVANSGCNNIANMGLRFYYGAHTNNPTSYGLPANYARLHNLVIIPTYRNNAGANIDFDPDKVNRASCLPATLNLPKNGVVTSVPWGDSTGTFALDHGQLGPPGSL
jgi:hypothetical protein